MYEAKQKLFEDIMALKDGIAQDKAEVKEKILTIQFLQSEKESLQNTCENLKEDLRHLEEKYNDEFSEKRQFEGKLALVQ